MTARTPCPAAASIQFLRRRRQRIPNPAIIIAALAGSGALEVGKDNPLATAKASKAECHEQGTNLRFVVTNRPGVASRNEGQLQYDDYIQRGENEHRMDAMKTGLHMDRLSCHRFMAKFFRLLLHAAAMNLLNAARDDKSLPQVLRVSQPCTW